MTTTPTSEPWQVSALDFPLNGEAAARLTLLLRYAVLAPSGHNTQPWLFSVRDDTVDLYADRTKALPVVDPDDRELTISCGAALFNLRHALRRFGYRDDVYELLPDPAETDLLARLRLVAGEPSLPEELALFEAIPRRRTTRARYSEREVPAGIELQLEEGVAREGSWLHLIDAGDREPIESRSRA